MRYNSHARIAASLCSRGLARTFMIEWHVRSLALVMLLAAGVARGQEPASRPRLVAFDRTERCLACHADLKSGVDFVANMSAKTWQEEDKHRRAFLLLEEQTELTTRILGFPLTDVVHDGQLRDDVTERGKLDAVTKCLRCHATWPKPKLADEVDQPQVDLRLGVSCQACHGPGFHWSRPHEEKWWRLCAVEEKERLGMTNLRSSAVKGALCTSCHVGSADEDRRVTHAMYAAGHPPLPGFELATFGMHMPPHWRTLAEKGAFAGTAAQPYPLTAQDRAALRQLPVDPNALKADYRAAQFPQHTHDPAEDQVAPREILAGGVAALRRYVELVEAGAKAQLESSDGWLDFALFDCRACHHELRGGRLPATAEGQRNRRTPAGRPPALTWPTVLALAAAQTLTPVDDAADSAARELSASLEQFDRALTARPFGDPRPTAAAAGRLRGQLDELARRVSLARFDDPLAQRLAAHLCADATLAAGFRPSAEYASARQVAWSLELLLARPRDAQGWQSVRAGLPRHFRGPDGEDWLRLRLPAGQRSSIVAEQSATLAAPDQYDPQWFRERLKSFATEFSRRPD